MSWLNMNKASEYAGVSRWTLQRWMQDGMKFYRMNNNMVRIHPDDIDAYIMRFKSGLDVDAEVQAILTKMRGRK